MATIQLKRGTAAALTAANPVLLAGEPCIETDTNRMKVGDGVKDWNTLPYETDLLGTKYLDMAGLAGGKIIAYNASSGKLEFATPTVDAIDGGVIT
jgi:hypothetical protein